MILLSLLLSAAAEDTEDEALPLLEVALADVKIRRREPIRVPDEAAELEVPRITCPMRVYIGPKGHPESVQVAECPEIFHQSVQDSVMAWRFKPIRDDDGDPVRATFVMAVTIPLNAVPEDSEEELE